MSLEDLKSLRKSIKFGDYFVLVYCIIFLILFSFSIATYENILGILIGYISVKFVYELQIRKYAKEEVKIGTNILFDIAIYGLAMFLMVLISDATLFTGALLIIIYRYLVLHKFKTLVS